jgi:hypothetical protein
VMPVSTVTWSGTRIGGPQDGDRRVAAAGGDLRKAESGGLHPDSFDAARSGRPAVSSGRDTNASKFTVTPAIAKLTTFFRSHLARTKWDRDRMAVT